MYDQIQETLRHQRSISQKEIGAICEANALGRKNNQQMFVEIEQIQTRSVNKQLEIIETAIVETSKSNTELHKILQLLKKEIQKELIEIQRRGFRNRLSDLEQDLEEQVAVLQALFATSQISDIYRKNLQSQLALVRQYTSITNNQEFLNYLRRKEADLLTRGDHEHTCH